MALKPYVGNSDVRSESLLSFLSTDGNTIETGPSLIMDGTNNFLMIQDLKTCLNCRQPCSNCIPSQKSSVGVSCSLANPELKSVATDTLDLFSETVVCVKNEDVGIEETSQDLFETEFFEPDSMPPESLEVKVEALVAKPESKNSLRPKRFVCVVCQKGFRTSRALKDHAPVHTGARDYICEICRKGYSTRANLLIHKRIHEGKKTFSCNECQKSFHKKDTLKVHIRNHTGEKPFVCRLCSASFVRKVFLQKHLRRHNAEKTFVCSVCGQRYFSLGGLKYHENTHFTSLEARKERKPAKKPESRNKKSILCQECGKIYSSMSNFRGHELIHKGQKPFTCNICNKVYAKKDSLRIHHRTHTEERLYACDVCDYAAYRNGTLKTHKLRHTGVRPHLCTKCGQSFTQSSSLAYHLKLKHQNKPFSKVSVYNSSNVPDVEPIILTVVQQ